MKNKLIWIVTEAPKVRNRKIMNCPRVKSREIQSQVFSEAEKVLEADEFVGTAVKDHIAALFRKAFVKPVKDFFFFSFFYSVVKHTAKHPNLSFILPVFLSVSPTINR